MQVLCPGLDSHQHLSRGNCGTRTRDPLVANEVLYRLS